MNVMGYSWLRVW